MIGGWGAGGWGLSPWGSGSAGFALLNALAIRTNLVRLYFSEPPNLTGILDPGDASAPDRYEIIPQESLGADGFPPRQVKPCKIEVADVPGAIGEQLDLWIDRPMSPYPALYLVNVSGIIASNGDPLLPGQTTATYLGLSAPLPKNLPTRVAGVRDLAQPDDAAATAGIGGVELVQLGGLPIDALGDYASDEGVVSYKKRVFRRLMTRKDGFKHLAGYGVGTMGQVKKLGSPAMRQALAADAESQIKLEPETIECKVTFRLDAARSLWFIVVRARCDVFGPSPIGMDVAFAPSS